MIILPLPETLSGVARTTFQIERVDFGAPQASGRQGGVQAGFPLWGARIEFDRVDPESGDIWRVFLDRLRGRIRRFYCGDPARPLPIAHRFGMLALTRAGGAAFDGSALTWAQGINADGDATMVFTGLPVAFTLSVGDYIGFKWDAAGAAAGTFERRTMVRVVDLAIANDAGVMGVLIEPPLDTALVPGSAVAHFNDPVCVMQQVPEQTQLGPTGIAGTLGGGTIVGIQDLRP